MNKNSAPNRKSSVIEHPAPPLLLKKDVPLRLQRLIIINTMEQKAFQQYSDDEFRDALIATMNLKQEWMAGLPPVILVRILDVTVTSTFVPLLLCPKSGHPFPLF